MHSIVLFEVTFVCLLHFFSAILLNSEDRKMYCVHNGCSLTGWVFHSFIHHNPSVWWQQYAFTYYNNALLLYSILLET